MQAGTQHNSSGADRLGGLVTGMTDGLVIPFALVSGLSNASLSSATIFQSGLIVTLVCAVAMGLGGYYTGTEQPHDHDHDLKGLAIDDQTQTLIKQEQDKDDLAWAKQQEEYGMGVLFADKATAWKHALFITLGYFLGGMIPVVAYAFYNIPADALRASCIITLISLFVFGFLKAGFMGRRPLWGALRSTAVGAVTATVAFLLAGLF